MAGNHLEQLISEWYEYQGYFVRRNVLVGRLPTGGHECELDIVAFHPATRHLVHIEPSLDADSWAKREERYRKKFDAGRKYIPALFTGLDLPGEIEQIAVLVFASKVHHQMVGGGRLVLASEVLEEILRGIKDKRLESHAIPKELPLLKTLQYVTEYRDVVVTALLAKP
jgi:hypothetical protein